MNGLPTPIRTGSYPLGGDCFIQLSDKELGSKYILKLHLTNLNRFKFIKFVYNSLYKIAKLHKIGGAKLSYIIKVLFFLLFSLFMSACNQDNSQNSTTNFRAVIANANIESIPVNAQIKITFSQDVNVKSLNKNNIYIIDKNKRSIDLEFTIMDKRTLLIRPKNIYGEFSEYTLILTKKIRSSDDENLLDVYTQTFVTDKNFDTTAPKLISILPDTSVRTILPNITSINTFTTFALEFNEVLRLDKAPYLKLTDAQGNEVDGINKSAGTSLRFIPATALNSNESYTLSLTQPIYDLSHNRYIGSNFWKFTPNTTIAYNRGHELYERSYSIEEKVNAVKKIEDSFYVFADKKLYNIKTDSLIAPFSINLDSNVYDAIEKDKILYIASDEGVISYDLTTNTLLHTFKTSHPVYAIDTYKDKIYIANTNSGISIFDTNNSTGFLSLESSIDTNATAFDILCREEGFYVALFSKGVVKYNYDDSNQSSEIVSTEKTPRKLHVKDNKLFIVSGIGGVNIVDLSTKENYHIPTLGYTMDIDLLDDNNTSYLYAAEKERGVSTYNISNLNAIKHLTQVSTNPSLYRESDLDHNINAIVTSKNRVITITRHGQINSFSLIPDLSELSITQTSPSNGDIQIDTNTTITIQFSQAIDESTLKDVSIKEGETALEILSQKYNKLSKSLSITMTKPFNENSWIYVNILGGIKNIFGTPINFSTYEFSFRTYSQDIIAPIVLSYTPDKSSSIIAPLTTPITVQISEALEPTSLKDGIELYQGDTLIASSFEYNATTHIIYVQADENLSYSEEAYSLKLYGTITDVYTNALKETQLALDILEPDTIKPEVISSVPNSASRIFSPYTKDIRIKMSEELNVSSLVDSIVLRVNSQRVIEHNATFETESNTLVINPITDLEEGSYSLLLKDTIKDLSNNTLNETDILFTVLSSNLAPSISSTSPINSQTSYSSSVFINFSEAMDAKSFIQNQSVTSSLAISKLIITSPTQIEIQLDTANITSPTNVSVTLSTAIQDVSGKNMLSTYTLSFIYNPFDPA